MQNLYFQYPLTEADAFARQLAFNTSDNDRRQATQALLKCGLKAKSCVAIDYEQFRELMSNFDAPSVNTNRGNTVIFDRHESNCVLIKPPYFDAHGQCQPIRYFWLEATQPLMPHLRMKNYLLKSPMASVFHLPRTLMHYLSTAIKQHKDKKLTQSQKHGVTVWTTMRLTA